MPINEPLQYYSAFGFYNEAKYISKKIKPNLGNKNFEFISPATVNYSFSAELFLKLLITLTVKKPLQQTSINNPKRAFKKI